MALSFLKYTCCQRDFLCPCPRLPCSPADAAKKLCDRKSGIGAEGLLLFSENEPQGISLTCYAPDGCQTPAPREAILIGAKFLYDTAVINLTEFCLSADGNPHRLHLETRGGQAWGVTLDLGYPRMDAGIWSSTRAGLLRHQPYPRENPRHRLTLVGFDTPYLFLTGDDTPPADVASLIGEFPAGATAALLDPKADPLSPRLLAFSGETDFTHLACAAATAVTICGDRDFGVPLAVSLSDGNRYVTVTPALRIYVTLEVKESIRGEMNL